jgi:hypothetical protein
MDHSKHITISRFVKKKKTISFIDRSNISIATFNHKFWYLFLNQILIIHYTILSYNNHVVYCFFDKKPSAQLLS